MADRVFPIDHLPQPQHEPPSPFSSELSDISFNVHSRHTPPSTPSPIHPPQQQKQPQPQKKQQAQEQPQKKQQAQGQQQTKQQALGQIVCHTPTAIVKAAPPPPLPPPRRKDVVYKIPHPLPPDHPSFAKVPPRLPCCSCLSMLSFLLTIILLFIAVAALGFFLAVQPRLPKYVVQDLRVSRFNVTSQPLNATAGTNSAADAPYLNSDIYLAINARNPNKIIRLDYDDVQVSVIYEKVQIGQGSIPPFYQGHKNTTILSLNLIGSNVALKKSVGAKLNESLAGKSNILLQIDTSAHVGIKIGGWKPCHMKVHGQCSVEITSPTSGTAEAVSQSCKMRRR